MAQYKEGSEIAGRFVIQSRIGEGGMGAVYRALQTSLDREVALKVLHSQNAFTSRARRRFAREARAVARLNHPHIAGVFDFGIDEEAQTLWLAMELIQGEALGVVKKQPLNLVALLSMTDQILSALGAAHARGIIHRDLKPSNVLIAQEEGAPSSIKLVDFGLAATQQGDRLSLEGAPGAVGEEESEVESVILGTPRYMAPEIFKRAPLDQRVDLYALGVMLFELIAGVPPFPGEEPREVMRGHLRDPIPQLVARDQQQVPADLSRCIYTLLEKEPEARYQSAAEVREVILKVLGEFSYAPWAAGGPRFDAGAFAAGGPSALGFVSTFGGQTIAPAAMRMGTSQLGRQLGQLAPLVGRAAERRVIEDRIRAALGGESGSLILLGGEAGSGKTRLIQWICVRVEEAGMMRVLKGAFTKGRGSFWGVRQALGQMLSVDSFSPDDLQYQVGRKLGHVGLGRDEVELCVKLLAPEGGAEDAQLFSDQERLFATIERLLRAWAKERPLLLVLEDLHDAGEVTLAFLEHLAVGLHLSPAPIVVIASMRAEGMEQSAHHREAIERLARFSSDDIVRLDLKRLSLAEAKTLVMKLLPLEDTLAEQIAARAAGNPLHVSQILRFLQESKKIQFDSGSWRLAEGVDLTKELPDEIADMMRYRVDQVWRYAPQPEATRAILERCAVLGTRFDSRLLSMLLGREEGAPWLGHLEGVLESLIGRDVLREEGVGGQDVLEFEHVMMRDVLLRDLRERRSQRVLHKLAAEAKVQFWGERVDDHATEIAGHYHWAKIPAGVYKYTLKAARHALALCDLKGAIRLFREAEGTLLALENESNLGHENTVALGHRIEQVTLEVAHLERRLGEYEPARKDYRKLLSSTSAEISLWARWGLGELSCDQGEFDEANSWFEAARKDALEMLQFSREGTAQVSTQLVDAYCLHGLGEVCLLRGDLHGAMAVLQEAIVRARGLREKLLETEVLRALSDVAWRTGETAKSEEYRRAAMLLVERFGDREEQAVANLHHAKHLRAIGHVGEADARAEQAVEAFDELGKRHFVAHGLMVRGQICWGRGANKEAAQFYRKAHRFYDMFQDRRGRTQCKFALAQLAFSIKRFSDAQNLVRDALEGFRAMGDRRGESEVQLLAGQLERELGQLSHAERTFSDVAQTTSELGDLRLAIVANLLRALTFEESGMSKSSDAILGDVTPLLEEYATVSEVMASTLGLLSVALSRRRPDLAIDYDTRSAKIWRQLGRTDAVAAQTAT